MFTYSIIVNINLQVKNRGIINAYLKVCSFAFKHVIIEDDWDEFSS